MYFRSLVYYNPVRPFSQGFVLIIPLTLTGSVHLSYRARYHFTRYTQGLALRSPLHKGRPNSHKILITVCRGLSLIKEAGEDYNIHMDKPYIPYNLKLKQKARELRKNQTKEEIVFYNQILKKHFKEYRFLKQKPIDGFILDFYCSKLNLGIEIDGGIHIAQKIRDKERDEILLNKHNIQVIRFSNKDVTHNVQNVVDVIKQCIKSP